MDRFGNLVHTALYFCCIGFGFVLGHWADDLFYGFDFDTFKKYAETAGIFIAIAGAALLWQRTVRFEKNSRLLEEKEHRERQRDFASEARAGIRMYASERKIERAAGAMYLVTLLRDENLDESLGREVFQAIYYSFAPDDFPRTIIDDTSLRKDEDGELVLVRDVVSNLGLQEWSKPERRKLWMHVDTLLYKLSQESSIRDRLMAAALSWHYKGKIDIPQRYDSSHIEPEQELPYEMHSQILNSFGDPLAVKK